MTSSDPDHLPKAPPPNIITFWVTAATYGYSGGTQTFSPQPVSYFPKTNSLWRSSCSGRMIFQLGPSLTLDRLRGLSMLELWTLCPLCFLLTTIWSPRTLGSQCSYDPLLRVCHEETVAPREVERGDQTVIWQVAGSEHEARAQPNPHSEPALLWRPACVRF